jgi:copper homeostasis protein
MKKLPLLEICVETLDAALAAERGGGDRVELCGDLSVGGVTPSATLMGVVREQLRIPIFAMIRPRGGDFCYSDAEFEQMKKEIGVAKTGRMNGLVFGILRRDGTVDVERNAELVELAKPLPVTFHRAFDETPDLFAALEDVLGAGFTRILTSGGATAAAAGSAKLAELARRAGQRITILAGGGIHPENIAAIAGATHADEFHSGLSSLLPYPRTEHAKFEAAVRRLKEILHQS